ncbi:hypothetical protein WA588_004092, partial [Blastocystis sp. NMH]
MFARKSLQCFFLCNAIKGVCSRSFVVQPKPLTEEMVKKIIKRDEELRKDYYDMPTEFPANSQPPNGKVTVDEALRKRLIHRSRQRGMLEVDLLLGKWSKENINRLTRDELDQYEALLNSETVDIFAWITGKTPLPPEMDLPIIREIKVWVQSKPFGAASPEEYAKNKQF